MWCKPPCNLTARPKGIFTEASLLASGFTDSGGGAYFFSGFVGATQTAIRQLVFNPTDNRVPTAQTETTTFTITIINFKAPPTVSSATTVISTSINDAPTVTGAEADQPVSDNATIAPFSAVVITDPDGGVLVDVTVLISNLAHGDFTAASLLLSGFDDAGPGAYTFRGSDAAGQAAIRLLAFQPVPNRVAVGLTETTGFTISVDDNFALPVSDALTTVIATSANDLAAITGTVAGQAINDNEIIALFSGVTVSDPDPGQILHLFVSYDDGAHGVFTPESLAASGFVLSKGGYECEGTVSELTAAVRLLMFDPADDRVDVGLTETTTFTVTPYDGFSKPNSDSTTTVISTSVNTLPTIGGVEAGQGVDEDGLVLPFQSITITDPDSLLLSVQISLDDPRQGRVHA